MADNKLEIEIIDDGDGGPARSLSPDDFSNIREFNRALARLKAEVRAQEFEASQELKARRASLKEQKVSLDEEKQAHKAKVEQTRMEVAQRKAQRQLDVVIAQEERAKDAAKNKQDRHREMMLRHILGAINPNSTFQYRMSSIYGLLNTAGITSSRNEDGEEGSSAPVNDVLKTLDSGLKILFGKAGQLISSMFGLNRGAGSGSAISSSFVTSAAAAVASQAAQPTDSEGDEEENPWWMNYRPKSFQPTKSDLARQTIKTLLPKPTNMINPVKFATPANIQMATPVKFATPANIKMAIPVAAPGAGAAAAGAAGGGGAIPPVVATGAAGGAGGFGGAMAGIAGVLGPIAIAGGIVVGVFAALGLATKLLSWRMSVAADAMRTWSGELIASKMNNQMKVMSNNIERGKKFGDSLASFENSKTDFSIALTRFSDSVIMPLVPVITGIYNFLANITNLISTIIEKITYIASGSFLFKNKEQEEKFWNFIYNMLELYSPFSIFLSNANNKNNGAMKDIAASLLDFLNAPVKPAAAVMRGGGPLVSAEFQLL